MTNPLLTSFLLPPFSSIRSEHVVPAVKFSIEYCRNIIDQVLMQSGPFTWDNFCQPLMDANDKLSRIWSPINHLNAVKNSPELREAYEQSLLMLSEYNTWVGQHKGLYQAYNDLYHSQHYSQLSIAQKKTIDNSLRDFKLSGINLSLDKQKRYGQIVSRLSELSSTYSNNVLDASMGWNKLITDKQEISGMPDSALIAAHVKTENYNQEGWLLTLDIPSYLAVLTYCDNTALRKEVYHAYNTRASDQGPNAGKWNNGPIMNEILALRHELAQLLGFNSYADKSLAIKMVRDPQQVLNFLFDLVMRTRPQGLQEFMQLCVFAKEQFNHDTLDPWDIAYYAEKQKQYLFSINDEQLRPYFPEFRVINGLFEVVRRIYGITVKERINIETWHSDVRFFDLFDEFGDLLGSFYLDLYTRKNKRSGAWMDDCVNMMRKANGKQQKPIAYITCNFNGPISGNPALFTHNEVITLFHEFGHGLHHMLTRIDTPGVSGINGVPWDAVELPSQFMENYCWQPEALEFISGHYKTGKSLSVSLLNKMLEVKKYQAALFIIRQLEFSLFDFCIHYQYCHKQGARVLEILSEVKKQVAIIPTVEWGRFPHTFSHIFAGGYAAGYYSYLWANVLSADVWSRFEEEGIFNRKTGESFLNNILAQGGSEDPMVLFTRFLGREPRLDAMLRHYGIQGNI